jgi:hypothetical protein
MKSNDIPEKQISNMSSIVGLMAWNKVGHLGKTVNDHKD